MVETIIGIIIPSLAIILLLYWFCIRIKIYIKKNYPGLIVNFIVNLVIVMLSVFIGAKLALDNTFKTNKEISIGNYKSMLTSCEQLESQYMGFVKNIIDSLNSNSQNLSTMNRFIKNMDKPLMLEELLRRSDLYNCMSADFKNWLPTYISVFQTEDWTISKKNIALYKSNYVHLYYIDSLIKNEIRFIDGKLSEDSLTHINNILRVPYYYSLHKIHTDDILKKSYEGYLHDSIKSEPEYLNYDTSIQENYWNFDTLKLNRFYP